MSFGEIELVEIHHFFDREGAGAPALLEVAQQALEVVAAGVGGLPVQVGGVAGVGQAVMSAPGEIQPAEGDSVLEGDRAVQLS